MDCVACRSIQFGDTGFSEFSQQIASYRLNSTYFMCTHSSNWTVSYNRTHTHQVLPFKPWNWHTANKKFLSTHFVCKSQFAFPVPSLFVHLRMALHLRLKLHQCIYFIRISAAHYVFISHFRYSSMCMKYSAIVIYVPCFHMVKINFQNNVQKLHSISLCVIQKQN